jgi:hypothetical protein
MSETEPIYSLKGKRVWVAGQTVWSVRLSFDASRRSLHPSHRCVTTSTSRDRRGEAWMKGKTADVFMAAAKEAASRRPVAGAVPV